MSKVNTEEPGKEQSDPDDDPNAPLGPDPWYAPDPPAPPPAPPPPVPGRKAARKGDVVACIVADHLDPNRTGAISKVSSFNVYIEGRLAGAQCDDTACPSLTLGTEQPGTITSGFGLVRICGMPAARIYDTMSHGGVINAGADQVFIGPPLTDAETVAAAVALAQAVDDAAIAAALAALAAAGKIRMEPIYPDTLPPGADVTTDHDGNVTSYRDPDGNVTVDPRYAKTPGDVRYWLAENQRQQAAGRP